MSINSVMMVDADAFTYKEMLLKPSLLPKRVNSEDKSRNCTHETDNKKKCLRALNTSEQDEIYSLHDEKISRYRKHRNGHTLRNYGFGASEVTERRKFSDRPSHFGGGAGARKVIERNSSYKSPPNPFCHGCSSEKTVKSWVRRQKRNERHSQRNECRKWKRKGFPKDY